MKPLIQITIIFNNQLQKENIMSYISLTYSNIKHIAVIAIILVCNSFTAVGQNWTGTNGPWRASVTDFAIGRTGGTTKIYSAVGTNVYRTTDGASNWTATSSVSGTPLLLTCKANADTVVLVALENYLKRNTSSGSGTWSNVINNDPIFHPKSLASSIANSSYMFVGIAKESLHSSMRRSVNSGVDWNTVGYFYDTVQTNVTALGPHTKNANLVWAGGTTAGSPPPEMYSKFYLGSTVTNGVFYSLNAGASWLHTGLNKNIVAVATDTIASPNTAVYAGTDDASHKLYKSTNATSGSATWTEVTAYSGGLISDIYIDQSNNIYVASADGIYKSTNGGTNWSSISCDGMYDKSNMKTVVVDPGSASNVYAGSPTTIFKSTNSGTSWSQAATGMTAMKTSAVAASGTRYLALSPGYSVVEKYVSPDWVVMGLGSEGCDQNFRGTTVTFKGSSTTYAFASGYQSSSGNTTASLYRNTSLIAGNYWESKYSGTNTSGKLNGVIVDEKNNNRIYIWGKELATSSTHKNFGVSIDAGSAWESTYVNTGTAEVSDVVFDTVGSAGTGYTKNLYASISSSDNGVWKSTTGGSSWSQLSSTNNKYRALGMNKYSGATLYAAQIPTGLYRTPTSSISWTQIRSDSVMKILAHPSYASSDNHIWVVASGGTKAYKTIDAGSNWTDVTANIPTPIYDLRRDVTSNQYIYAATASGVYKIDPAPEKPEGVVRDEQSACTSPCFIWDEAEEVDLPTYKYYIYKKRGTVGGYIYLASTSSASFVDYSEELGGSGNPLNISYYVKTVDNGGNLSPQSDTVNFTVSEYGDDKASVQAIEELPTEFSLSQNYPNPFNPVTEIKYALPVDASVSLKVFDIFGREVATLVFGNKVAGYYSAEFDALKVSSGMYFYRLTATGEGKSFTQVRKMILMK